jgi:RNA polymerase sigma factor (sigma-70 family)
VGKLSPNQQEVLRLRFEEGFSYQEIAQVTGLSVTNVGFLLHAALKAIRLQMEPAEDSWVLRRIK